MIRRNFMSCKLFPCQKSQHDNMLHRSSDKKSREASSIFNLVYHAADRSGFAIGHMRHECLSVVGVTTIG